MRISGGIVTPICLAVLRLIANSNFVGRSTGNEVVAGFDNILLRQIDIQPHSKTHSNLTMKLADENEARYRERIRREVDVPIEAIRERLGEPTLSYAFPYGDVNDIVVEYLRAKNVKLGVTVTPGGNAFFAPPVMLRRSMVFGGDDLDVFKSKLVTALPVARP